MAFSRITPLFQACVFFDANFDEVVDLNSTTEKKRLVELHWERSDLGWELNDAMKIFYNNRRNITESNNVLLIQHRDLFRLDSGRLT